QPETHPSAIYRALPGVPPIPTPSAPATPPRGVSIWRAASPASSHPHAAPLRPPHPPAAKPRPIWLAPPACAAPPAVACSAVSPAPNRIAAAAIPVVLVYSASRASPVCGF
ncbi:MAG: hypothetical protein D8B42_09750, partial [Kingella sp. (in: b-proteobacteria)]